MTLVSQGKHICPSCGKIWDCFPDCESTIEYLCSKCKNSVTKFGERQ